ncbi:hypothetical protein Rs2_44220 [Raphanus sativus]|nr:hypothetical protein Rs2_44220 [Raphanus sativus]
MSRLICLLGTLDSKFNNGDELEVKEGESKYELRKSKRCLVFLMKVILVQMQTSRFIGPVIANPQWLRNQMVQQNTKVTSLQYVSRCSNQARLLGGHKRSHSFESQRTHDQTQSSSMLEKVFFKRGRKPRSYSVGKK